MGLMGWSCGVCNGTGKIYKKVEWDSGKVSNWLSQNFEAITDADADQLHKILTGGEK